MVQFKLQHRGLVRKVTFKNVDQPSWHELSWKIGDVCNIPHAAVGLTYLDPDGDKITISSQAELNEYYSSLDEEELEANAPHKFIVRNLNEGIPDDAARDPREDNFLMGDSKTMAASTVGGGSQWGFNPEDEAERDPTKLRLSGYSTFADALGPLAGSTVGAEDYTETDDDKDDLPGGFKAPPSPQPAQPAKSSGWGLPMFGGWGASKSASNAQPSTSPPADPAPKQATNMNPWDNDQNVTKTPAWASATTPTSTKAPPIPWAPPSSVATGALKGNLGRGAPSATPASTNLGSSTGPGGTVRPSGIVPPPVAPIVQMDSMVADRATGYAPSPAFTATLPKKKKKRMTQAERAKEEEAAKRAAEARKIEEMELKAMEREANREREENARASAEAAARAAVEDQRRMEDQRRIEEREWDRERERLKAEEDQRRREREQPAYQAHQRGPSDFSYSDEWQHVNNQSPEQEDEEAYRARIEAARANVFGTSPTAPQPPPSSRQRKSSTKSKGEKSTGKSSRPNSKVYPPTPAPKKYPDSGLGTEDGHDVWNVPTVSGHPPGGANATTAQVCGDVADLLVSFGRILDHERDLLDAIRETFSHKLAPGALNETFGNQNLSPEMLRIVASVDDLLTKILPSRPGDSPHGGVNMELEQRIPTPSVTPAPIVPAEPEFGVPKTEFGNSFEFANRGRQGVPVINVPRPKYPASPLTRDGYSTGTTPPAQSQGYAASSFLSASPDKAARARSRSRPPPGDFEIVPPSHLPPQARVVPPPVVPGEETDDSPMTPDASRGFARQSVHEGGLVLATPSQRSTADMSKADMEAARQHYKSQRELYKLERAERKKEMEERAAAKAERKRAKAALNSDPNIADLTNQLQNLVPPRPFEADRRYIESPYEQPRTAGPYPGPGNTVYAEGLGKVTLMPVNFPNNAAVTAPASPTHDEPTQSFERARRRRQSLNGASPERYSRPSTSAASRTESYHGLQPDAYGAPHHSPYAPAPPQQDLAKRVALRLTEMGYTPQKYPALPAILGHRIRPLTNTPGVNENEIAYHIIQDLFKYGGPHN